MADYLLIKRDLYWRPGGMGYTGIKDNAGRYSREEAEKIVGHGVTMVPFDEAPDFTNACFDDLARDHLIKQRDEALAMHKIAFNAGVHWQDKCKLLQEALRQIDALAYSHKKGAIGEAQKIARKALAQP